MRLFKHILSYPSPYMKELALGLSFGDGRVGSALFSKGVTKELCSKDCKESSQHKMNQKGWKGSIRRVLLKRIRKNLKLSSREPFEKQGYAFIFEEQ